MLHEMGKMITSFEIQRNIINWKTEISDILTTYTKQQDHKDKLIYLQNKLIKLLERLLSLDTNDFDNNQKIIETQTYINSIKELIKSIKEDLGIC